jgi:Na+/proline symporter
LADQFKSIVIALLFFAGVLAFVFLDHIEGLAIFIIPVVAAPIVRRISNLLYRS